MPGSVWARLEGIRWVLEIGVWTPVGVCAREEPEERFAVVGFVAGLLAEGAGLGAVGGAVVGGIWVRGVVGVEGAGAGCALEG